MKYILLLLAFACNNCLIAQVSSNQISLPNHVLKAKNESDRMNELLKFNSEQFDSVKVINRDYYYQIAFLESFKLSIPDRKNKLLAIDKSRLYRLEKNLSTGDYKKYFDSRTEKKIKWQRREDSLQAKRPR